MTPSFMNIGQVELKTLTSVPNQKTRIRLQTLET